jgi:hypothetical protein
MSFTVSVRPTRPLEQALRKGEPFVWPEEITHNSNVVYGLLGYADRVVPAFAGLSDPERRMVADSVSYMMRPDIIKERVSRGPSEPGVVHLRNDPSVLNPEFGYYGGNVGAELYRCISATILWIPSVWEKVKDGAGSCAPAFKLADMMSFLLEPSDISDYRYTRKEIAAYEATLAREWNRI